MIFGDKSTIAIEISLATVSWKNALYGSFCYRIDNHMIGDFSQEEFVTQFIIFLKRLRRAKAVRLDTLPFDTSTFLDAVYDKYSHGDDSDFHGLSYSQLTSLFFIPFADPFDGCVGIRYLMASEEQFVWKTPIHTTRTFSTSPGKFDRVANEFLAAVDPCPDWQP